MALGFASSIELLDSFVFHRGVEEQATGLQQQAHVVKKHQPKQQNTHTKHRKSKSKESKTPNINTPNFKTQHDTAASIHHMT